MKKKYDSPSIQKVSFRYRDQVVAASGADAVIEEAGNQDYGSTAWNNWYNSLPGWAQSIIDGIINMFG